MAMVMSKTEFSVISMMDQDQWTPDHDIKNAWVDCHASLKTRRGRRQPSESYLRDDISCGLESCQQCNMPRVLDSSGFILMPDAEALSSFHEVLQLPEVSNAILLNSVLMQSHLSKSREVKTKAMIRDKRKKFFLFDDLHHIMTHAGPSALVPQDQVASHLPPYCSPSLLDGSSIQVACVRQMMSSAAFLLMHWRSTLDDPPPIVILSSLARKPVAEGQERKEEQGDDDTSIEALLSLMDLEKPTNHEAPKHEPSCPWPPTRGMIHIISPDQLFSSQCWAKTHPESSAVKLAESIATGLSARGGNAAGSHESSEGPPHWNQAQISHGLASGILIKGKLDVSRRSRREGVVIVSSASSQSRAGDVEEGAIDEGEDGSEGRAGSIKRKVDGDQLGRMLRVSGLAAMNRAMHGDLVVVQLIPTHKEGGPIDNLDDDSGGEEGPETKAYGGEGEGDQPMDLPGCLSLPLAQVVAILSRDQSDIVACLRREDEEALLQSSKSSSAAGSEVVIALPLDPRLPLVRIKTRQAQQLANQRFVLRIDAWDRGSKWPSGHVVRVLGNLGTLEAESEAVLIKCGISHLPFCQAALDELPRVSTPSEWQISESERLTRRDLTSCLVCSIDPPGCTDVDDALHVKHLPSGLVECGVHIADVSHFVQEGGYLDSEARDRCTSIYLVDRRLDMLPALLSEQLCSLRSGSERLAVSVIWTMDQQSNEVKDVWIGRSIIKSSYQLTYQEAQDIYEGRPPGYIPHPDASGLHSSISFLFTLTRSLRAKRKEAGALLELAGNELRFKTDPISGRPIEVSRKEKLEAMDMIAEMMILANNAVAKQLVRDYPGSALLRNHPPPSSKSFDSVTPFLSLDGTAIDPGSNKRVAAALDQAIERMRAQDNNAAASLVSSLMTRSMNEAQYLSSGSISSGSQSHYGLALDYYTHFTSPIRRYADIVVHRQLLKTATTSHQDLVLMASRMNERHRQAKEASKACNELYLLDLFATSPQIVEALVVKIAKDRSLIEVYVPEYSMNGVIRLTDASGQVISPLGHDSDSKATLSIKISSQLGDLSAAQSIEMLANESVAIWSAAEWGKVYVQLGAQSSRAHGLQRQTRLCLDPLHPRSGSKTTLQLKPVSPFLLPCPRVSPRAEIESHQQSNYEEQEDEGRNEGWKVTHQPVEIMGRVEGSRELRERRELIARANAKIDRCPPGSKRRSELLEMLKMINQSPSC